MLYASFWVIPRRLNFICRRFGTLCLIHLHRQVGSCRMNSAGYMFGVLYGKRFGSEMAWAIMTEGDRVGGGSEYRNKLWRVPAYIEADGRVCEGDRGRVGGRQGMVDVVECSETSVYKIQTPGNHPKESTQNTSYITPPEGCLAAPRPPSPIYWVVHKSSYKISESQHTKISFSLIEIWYLEERGFSREVRRLGLEAAHLTSSSIEVINAWTCICTWVTCTRLNDVCSSEPSTVSSKPHQAYSLFEFLTYFSVCSDEFWDNSIK